jgi:hypothetical protein
MSTPFVVPTIPDAPQNLKEHPKAMVRKLWQVIDQNVDEAREAAEIVGTYRKAQSESFELLRTDTEHPEAAAYRKANSQMIDRIKDYQKEYDDAIAPFAKRLEDQKSEARAIVDQKRSEALKAIGINSDVTAEQSLEAIENYNAAAEMVAMVVAKMKKQGVETTFSLPVIDPKSGKKGTGETRGFTPRFSKVVINGVELTVPEGKTPKLTDIVAKIGIATFDRDYILSRLPSKDDWEALESGTDVTAQPMKWTDVKDDSKSMEYTVTVTKAFPAVRAVKNTDGTLTEAPDDDDDDDDESSS